MRLLVIIVNYRSVDLACDCLTSIQEEIREIGNSAACVVENASGEAALLRWNIEKHHWSSWCQLIDLESNQGFAAGNNAAIRNAFQQDPPQYVLLLNPDTVVTPGAIKRLLSFIEHNPSVGVVGSRLEWENGVGQRAARRFPSIASEFEGAIRIGPVSRLLTRYTIAPDEPDIATETDWVVGAAMLVRGNVFEDIGLLDEKYFLYFEEVDFCRRAKGVGWQTWYLPTSRVIHYVGSSSGVTSVEKKGRCPTYWFESRRRYFLKNHGRITLYLANLAHAAGLVVHRFRQIVLRQPSTDHDSFLTDFIRFNFLQRHRVVES